VGNLGHVERAEYVLQQKPGNEARRSERAKPDVTVTDQGNEVRKLGFLLDNAFGAAEIGGLSHECPDERTGNEAGGTGCRERDAPAVHRGHLRRQHGSYCQAYGRGGAHDDAEFRPRRAGGDDSLTMALMIDQHGPSANPIAALAMSI